MSSKNDDLTTLIKFWEQISAVGLKEGWNALLEEAKKQKKEQIFRQIVFLMFRGSQVHEITNELMTKTTNTLQLKQQNRKNNTLQNVNNSKIENIPNQLLCKIFSYLNGSELNKQQKICRRFLYESRKPISYHNEYFSFIIGTWSVSELICKLRMKYSKYWKVKRLVIILPTRCTLLRLFCKEKPYTLNEQLQRQYLRIPPFGEIFKSVETLTLASKESIKIDPSRICGGFEKLKKLNLLNVNMINWNMFSKPLTVHDMCVNDSTDLNGDNKFGLYSTGDILSKIKLTGFKSDDWKMMKLISHPFEDLKGLEIRNCVVTNEIATLFKQLCVAPNLEYLVINFKWSHLGNYDYMPNLNINLRKVKEIFIEIKEFDCTFDINLVKLFNWYSNKPQNVVISHRFGIDSVGPVNSIKSFFENNKMLLTNELIFY